MYQLAEASPTAPVPPQNLDAEESVLGAMMLSPGAIGAVSEVLSASDFYRGSHATIYRAMVTAGGVDAGETTTSVLRTVLDLCGIPMDGSHVTMPAPPPRDPFRRG